jgi:hypothetical protein
MNVYWPDGTAMHLCTSEDAATVAAVVEEFLDLVETSGDGYTYLADRFMRWYGPDLVAIGARPSSGNVHIAHVPSSERPTVW